MATVLITIPPTNQQVTNTQLQATNKLFVALT